MAKWIQSLLIALLVVLGTGTVVFGSGGASPPSQESSGEPIAQGWLGIAIMNINERVVDHFGLTVSSGVVIVKVAPDGPGGTAGLQIGDVILAIDGVAVSTVDQVVDIIQATAPGTTVTLTVLREGVEQDVPVVVGEQPVPQVYGNPIPPYAQRLLTPELLTSLLNADYELLGKDGQVINVGLTLGEVKSTTDSGLLTITRKDGVDAGFQLTADARIAIGRYPIKLVGFIEGTTVLVVEKDGEVTAVVGGLRELLRHPRVKHARPMPLHQATSPPPVRVLPEQGFGGMLREFAPGSQLQTRIRRLGPEMREQLKRYRGFLRSPFLERDGTVDAPAPAPEQEDTGIRL